MAALHDIEESSRKLWAVQEMPDGGRRATKVHHLVWSETPEAANKLAVAFWGQFDKRWMDSMDNVDGASTAAGECYQGFACIDCGAGSVSLYVDPVDTNPWFLGTNAIKKALKSRRLDCSTDGAKGDAARRLLADRLESYISAPNQKKEKDCGASVDDGTVASSSSSSTSAAGSAIASSIDVASPEPPASKKMKVAEASKDGCFSKLAADLHCPADCYLVITMHDELSFTVISKTEKKPLRGVFMQWIFQEGTGCAKPDVENIYNIVCLQDGTLSEGAFCILKQFIVAHMISSVGMLDYDYGWEEFCAERDGVPPHLDWMEEVHYQSRVFGHETAVRKIS